jgi:hypothetical protein
MLLTAGLVPTFWCKFCSKGVLRGHSGAAHHHSSAWNSPVLSIDLDNTDVDSLVHVLSH